MNMYYGTTMTELAKGRAYRNPEFFLKGDPRATDVIIVGNYPAIQNTYEAMGVPVTVVPSDDWTTLNKRTTPRTIVQDEPRSVVSTSAPVEQPSRPARTSLVVPADWQQMPWADLRRLAASVSGRVIINKTEAHAAIRKALLAQGDNGEVDGIASTRR